VTQSLVQENVNQSEHGSSLLKEDLSASIVQEDVRESNVEAKMREIER
jgi:hypothetical protein